MYLDVPDGEVVRRIASGSGDAREAEAEFCRRFAPRIRLYGLRHLRDEDCARELVQAVLLGVLVAAREGRVADPDHVDRYVLGTCRNVALRVREVAARAEPTDAADAVAGISVDPVNLSTLMRCLSQLEVRARRVVMLSFQHGEWADEVATRLQTTAGNVRVIRHRSVAALRRCLDEHGAAP